jgi:hypothetical protein
MNVFLTNSTAKQGTQRQVPETRQQQSERLLVRALFAIASDIRLAPDFQIDPNNDWRVEL